MYNQIKRAVSRTAHGHQRRVLCPIMIIQFAISILLMVGNRSTIKRMNTPITTVTLFWWATQHVWRGSRLKVNARSKDCIQPQRHATLRHGLQATICPIPIARTSLSGIRLNQYGEVNSLLFFVKKIYTQIDSILEYLFYTQTVLRTCFRM